MLDKRKFGTIITSMRKSLGMPQEKLAELLFVSPQAVSKWENGHTLPPTSLLPVLAQIFGCSIDALMMPAYTADESIETNPSVSQRIIPTENSFYDEEIASSVRKQTGLYEILTVQRGLSQNMDGRLVREIAVSSSSSHLDLLETFYPSDDAQLNRYLFLSSYISCIPKLFRADSDRHLLLTENVEKNSVSGCEYDEETPAGDFFRENITEILHTAAEWHAKFWMNNPAFTEIGLDWRHRSQENIFAHISAMEKDFETYRENERSGKIPRVWQGMKNHITEKQFEYYTDAVRRLRNEYPARFPAGENFTVIHGDMHPGTAHIDRDKRTVKFTGLQAVRIGLCTEDLAMLIALHIEPERKKSIPMLDEYYSALTSCIKSYPYELFMQDYRFAVTEAMFFPIRLMNRGIFDFSMRDRAIHAYETWVYGQ